MTVSLKSILAPNKKVTVDFPGMPGFTVQLAFLSREITLNIRKKSTKTVFKGKHTQEEFDEDMFLKLYTEQTVLGWEGLKFGYLEQLAPVDLSGVDPEDFLEYTTENALYLVKNSSVFDSFVSDQVGDLGNFTSSK
jgi:hypothetical protein